MYVIINSEDHMRYRYTTLNLDSAWIESFNRPLDLLIDHFHFFFLRLFQDNRKNDTIKIYELGTFNRFPNIFK
jgi:hypothetical protein